MGDRGCAKPAKRSASAAWSSAKAWKTPTWGYAFLETFWGKGYAREAAAATLAHARDAIGLEKVVAITSPSNAGSIAVLEKIGMKAAGTIQIPGYAGESAYFTT